MKYFSPATLLSILLINVRLLSAQTNPIGDWISPYKDTSFIKQIDDADKRILYKIVHDFNCDGVIDIALCDPYIGGAHDIPWHIFLQDSKHIYHNVGEIWCEDFLSAKRIASKSSKLIAYEHWDAEEGFLNEYKVSFNGIKHLRRYSTKSVSQSYIDSLWAHWDFVQWECPIPTLLKNINSEWKKR